MSDLLHNMLYSCEEYRKRGNEQLVTEHSLGYIISGETHFHTNAGTHIYGEGTIGFIRKNQLAKTIKVPAADSRPFKSISILLSQSALRQYSAENNIPPQGRYMGDTMISLTGDHFIKSYFDSLLPYFDKPGQLNPALVALKTKEAIELLLRAKPWLQGLLFDFTEPYKIDLEAFMNQNYSYNIPISRFAQLSGRSLATFKRDFNKVFTLPPEKWLLHKRLELAHFLIKEKGKKPGEIYAEAGFENMSHFSRSFKNLYGISPSQLRNNGLK